MKVNCDRYKDWRKARAAAKLAAKREWHKQLYLYRRVGPNDCRLFEYVERRLVPKTYTPIGIAGTWWPLTWDEWEFRND